VPNKPGDIAVEHLCGGAPAGTYARVGWRQPYKKDVDLLKLAALDARLDRKVVFDALRGVQRAKLPVLLPLVPEWITAAAQPCCPTQGFELELARMDA
jgi:hypothetical protein